MAYWIFENGESIGPLDAQEVVERAQADSQVSHGQEWVPFRKHPDFGHVVSTISAPRRPGPAPLAEVADFPRAIRAETPQAATVSDPDSATPATNSPRVRRLRNDFDRVVSRFDDWPLISIDFSGGNPPDTYRVWFKINGLYVAGDGEILERDEHVVEIKLGLQYPRRPPQSKLLTPLFHPNFNNTEICAQDTYAASEGLDDLIIRIGRMIAYQDYNTKSPLNGIAAKWAAEHSALLPVDAREIAPPHKPKDADVAVRENEEFAATGTGA